MEAAFQAFNNTAPTSSSILGLNGDKDISIQIEVDIEPPEEGLGGLTSEQLERLGLPSHHVHYKTGQEKTRLKEDLEQHKKTKQQERIGHGAELLEPEDIKSVLHSE